jgi:hypothetical protein
MRFQTAARYALWCSAILFTLTVASFNAASQQTTQPAAATDFKLTPDRQAALDQISENSLRGHLSFIASDLLEGRATPSRGLDIAAEYIAAQFRRAGLEQSAMLTSEARRVIFNRQLATDGRQCGGVYVDAQRCPAEARRRCFAGQLCR